MAHTNLGRVRTAVGAVAAALCLSACAPNDEGLDVLDADADTENVDADAVEDGTVTDNLETTDELDVEGVAETSTSDSFFDLLAGTRTGLEPGVADAYIDFVAALDTFDRGDAERATVEALITDGYLERIAAAWEPTGLQAAREPNVVRIDVEDDGDTARLADCMLDPRVTDDDDAPLGLWRLSSASLVRDGDAWLVDRFEDLEGVALVECIPPQVTEEINEFYVEALPAKWDAVSEASAPEHDLADFNEFLGPNFGDGVDDFNDWYRNNGAHVNIQVELTLIPYEARPHLIMALSCENPVVAEAVDTATGEAIADVNAGLMGWTVALLRDDDGAWMLDARFDGRTDIEECTSLTEFDHTMSNM